MASFSEVSARFALSLSIRTPEDPMPDDPSLRMDVVSSWDNANPACVRWGVGAPVLSGGIYENQAVFIRAFRISVQTPKKDGLSATSIVTSTVDKAIPPEFPDRPTVWKRVKQVGKQKLLRLQGHGSKETENLEVVSTGDMSKVVHFENLARTQKATFSFALTIIFSLPTSGAS